MKSLVVASLLMTAAPARAEDGARDLCPDRPGLGTPPCTMVPGKVMVELGVGDWTLDKDAERRTDSFVGGDLLVRLGVTDSTEVQLGWTALGHVRTRNRQTGAVEKMTGTGDVTLAVRQNLHNPDGSGVSIALMPYASLPTGGQTIGSGDWGAGLIVPVSIDLGGGLALGLTPEVDAAVDEDRNGRHLAYGSVIGLAYDLSKDVGATLELSSTRDRDPGGHSTETLAGLSVGWQTNDDIQLDVGVNAGLNETSADAEVYFGIARRF